MPISIPFISPPSASSGASHNTHQSYSSRCRARIYHFSDINPAATATSGITETEIIDLDSNNSDGNPLLSYSYTKSNSGCAGYFQINLAPTSNWLQRIKAGDWITIFMSNGATSTESLRCLGIVDAVSMNERISPSNGARTITFNINGRDFGKVFERYMIYINYFVINGSGQAELLRQLLISDVLLALKGSPDEVVKNLVKTFLGRGASGFAFTGQEQMDQWYIPEALAKDFGSTLGKDSKFFDILSMDDGSIQSGLPGYKIATNPDVRTPLWTLLQEHANLDFNEMFVELMDIGDKVKPALFLRTIPYTFKDYKDPNGILDSSLKFFLDLPSVDIKGNVILSSDTRLHEHDRFTFIAYLSDSLDPSSNSGIPSVALMNGKFPFIDASSCKRYGLTVYERTGDYMLVRGDQAVLDANLLLAWNGLLVHWYENNAYFEEATINIAGRGDVRLGKRLTITDSPLLAGLNNVSRSYYIEAYVDNWEYGQPWTQQLVLTRGIFVDSGKEKFSYEVYSKDNLFNAATHTRRK